MTDVLGLFRDPDEVGESEYRAIYNLLSDALETERPEDRTDMCRSILTELADTAENMLAIIDKNNPPQEDE